MTDPLAPDPPAKKGLSTTAIVAIVIAAGICIPGVIFVVAGAVGAASVVVPRMAQKQQRVQCQANLAQLAQVFAVTQPAGAAAPRSGPGLFLEWRKSLRMIRPGEEAILLCPADPVPPCADRSAWDTVDLDHPAAGLCSYVVRDFAAFPLPADAATVEPIAACLHHAESARARGGAVVAYSDGHVAWIGFEELGISEGAELVAGPASKSPILRKMKQ